MTADVSAQYVARWMIQELGRATLLYQEIVVYQIQQKFGDKFTYTNSNGNLAIAKSVLDAFAKETGRDVVWCRSERYWRLRQEGDQPGRQQP